MKDLAPNSCQKMKMSGLCKNTSTIPKYRNTEAVFSGKFYWNLFNSVSKESSRREISALSSGITDLPPSVIRI